VANESNDALVVFDISNPTSPVEVGSTTSGLNTPTYVYVQGRYAYVADSVNGLVIFDISNPTSPIKVGSSTAGLTGPVSIYVQGRYAYLADGNNGNGLVIFDISNPTSPIKVGSSTAGLADPQSVYVQGRYAYVADESNGLVTFDISNPTSPVEVGSSTTGLNEPFFVYVQGRYAYVASFNNNSLVIFDISNPTSPSKVGSSTSGLSQPISVYVSGRYAYVASRGNNSLIVFDISNPVSPIKVGSNASGLNNPHFVSVYGRYAYVASFGNSSLVVFQVGGAYVQSIEAGTLQAGSLQLDNNLQALDGAFQGGLTVGNNLNVGGSFSLTASTYNATTTAGKNYSIFSLNTASSTNPLLTTLYNGNVGIGTSTPYSRLEVFGPDTASTSVFTVVNSASTTEFSVYDTGNAVLAGGLTQSSDQRLKTNIQSLDASSSLSLIDELNPVTFNWIDPNKGAVPQLGFIAQQVLPIFPDLISTTSATALTPDGTLSLNYIGLISPMVSAIQQLSADIVSIENTIAGFATSFATNELTFDRGTGQELCLSNGPSDQSPVCVTKDQLAVLLSAAVASQSAGSDASITTPSVIPATAPIIQINGDNPAIVQIGDTYNDPGATITGPQADLNLGIRTYLNGTLASNIVLDTSEPATDTIDYVVTDQNGLTSTSSRTVIVDAPAQMNVPFQVATSTDAAATSSAQ
jgi:hypothetical protein